MYQVTKNSILLTLFLGSAALSMQGVDESAPHYLTGNLNVIGGLKDAHENRRRDGRFIEFIIAGKPTHPYFHTRSIGICRTSNDDLFIWFKDTKKDFLGRGGDALAILDILDPMVNEKPGIIKRTNGEFNTGPEYQTVSTSATTDFLKILHDKRLIDECVLDLIKAELVGIDFPFTDFR